MFQNAPTLHSNQDAYETFTLTESPDCTTFLNYVISSNTQEQKSMSHVFF